GIDLVGNERRVAGSERLLCLESLELIQWKRHSVYRAGISGDHRSRVGRTLRRCEITVRKPQPARKRNTRSETVLRCVLCSGIAIRQAVTRSLRHIRLRAACAVGEAVCGQTAADPEHASNRAEAAPFYADFSMSLAAAWS